MSKGRRYDKEQKLNIKKVIAVIMAIAVIIMFVIGIKTLLTQENTNQTKLVVSNYYPVYTNGKWGVIDQTGKIVIEPAYEEIITIPSYKTDLFICVYDIDYTNETYKTKVLDSKNKEKFTGYDLVEVIENRDSNNILWYEEEVLKVKKDGKYGLIDYSGKEILPTEYDSIEALEGVKNSIVITKEEKLGLCNNKGDIIIEPQYKEIKSVGDDYRNGYVVVNSDNKYGLIDFTKQVILEEKYEEVKTVVGTNLYVVKEEGKLKIINKDLETLVENKFDDVKQINGENLVFVKNKKYGIMNIAGQIRTKAEYDNIEYIFDNYYIAKKSDKYGIINIENENILPFEYEKISYRKEADFIEVEKKNAEFTEILNNKFEKQLEGIITEVNTDKEYIRVRIGDEYKYYNFKLEEKDVKELLNSNTIFLSKRDGKYGYVDKEGKVVVDYIYEDAKEQNSYGYAAVKKDGKWGSIDQEGKETSECKYDLENNVIIDFIGKWHIGEDLNSYYYTDM